MGEKLFLSFCIIADCHIAARWGCANNLFILEMFITFFSRPRSYGVGSFSLKVHFVMECLDKILNIERKECVSFSAVICFNLRKLIQMSWFWIQDRTNLETVKLWSIVVKWLLIWIKQVLILRKELARSKSGLIKRIEKRGLGPERSWNPLFYFK